jgi:hypothetical protein
MPSCARAHLSQFRPSPRDPKNVRRDNTATGAPKFCAVSHLFHKVDVFLRLGVRPNRQVRRHLQSRTKQAPEPGLVRVKSQLRAEAGAHLDMTAERGQRDRDPRNGGGDDDFDDDAQLYLEGRLTWLKERFWGTKFRVKG